VQTSDTSSASTFGGNSASPFDSLDVDGLLNASTSGLEKSKLSANRRSQAARQKGHAPKPPVPTQTTTGAKDKKEYVEQDVSPVKADPDPSLIAEELEFAWAKKKDKKQAANEQKLIAAAERAQSNSGAGREEAELDEEELAIYAAVTQQNRRKNLIWAMIAAILAISIGGYFAKREYQLLGKPLSQSERDWLIERGFVLKASRVVNINGDDDDGAAVMVAAGKSFSDVDQFGSTVNDLEGNGNEIKRPGDRLDPRRGFGPKRADAFADRRSNALQPNPRNNPRNNPRVKPLPKVDFDTNVDSSTLATAAIRSSQQIPFSGNTFTAFSPRGHAYVAGRKFIKGVSAEGAVFFQRTLDRPLHAVTAIVASSDGRYVIVGGDAGSVQGYQVDAKGRLGYCWKLKQVHRDKIIHLRVSGDSKQLAVYSADGRLTIWDLEQQLIELNLSDLVPEVRLTSFQLTDDAVLLGSSDGLRQVRLGESKVDLVSLNKKYRLLAVDRTGDSVIVSDGSRISAIDFASKRNKWVQTIRIADKARIEFSPDGETAFYHDGGKDILHFEVSSGRILHRYGDDRLEFVNRVSVSHDGKELSASGDSQSVLVYIVKDAKPFEMPDLKSPLASAQRTYPPSVVDDEADVVSVAQSRVTDDNPSAVCLTDNGFLIAAEKGRTIVFDWTADRIVYERFDSGQDNVTTMTMIGNKLVLGRSSGMIEVSEIEPDGKLERFKEVGGHVDPVKFVTPIPKTSLVASVTQLGHTRVWDICDAQKNETVYIGNPIASTVQSVVVDRRSDVLLAAGDELATLDYKTGNTKLKKGEVRFRNVTILPDGKRLAFIDRGKLNLATTSRGEINLSIDLPKGATSVSFSPNSKLAFLFADERVFVYRLRGGKEIFSFAIASRATSETKMIFSADKKFMTPFNPKSKGNFRIYATPFF